MNLQEQFWKGEFGSQYIKRNSSDKLFDSNCAFFRKALAKADDWSSVIEFGANIGINLRALRSFIPNLSGLAIEINHDACKLLRDLKHIADIEVFEGSALDYSVMTQYDLALTKGFLIHIAPENLPEIYRKIYHSSRRYILICEYFNPIPVAVNYQGNSNVLWKRDFADDLLEMFPALEVIDYGFVWDQDPIMPQDNITYFLMEKK